MIPAFQLGFYFSGSPVLEVGWEVGAFGTGALSSASTGSGGYFLAADHFWVGSQAVAQSPMAVLLVPKS